MRTGHVTKHGGGALNAASSTGNTNAPERKPKKGCSLVSGLIGPSMQENAHTCTSNEGKLCTVRALGPML
jgi:hypothetical protein